MLGLLSRNESKSIFKTASDDADTLSAHESDTSIGLPDGKSVTTSKLDDREFDFDFEIINTAAYRKVFNMARSKLPPENGTRVYSPPHAPASSGVSASETVGSPSINAHGEIHPVVASQESEPFSSRPNALSRDIRSHSILPKDSAEAAADGTTIELVINNEPRADYGSPYALPKWALKLMRPSLKKPALAGPRPIIKNHLDSSGMREEEHDADLENQPESTSKKSEFRIGKYSVGTTIGTGRKGITSVQSEELTFSNDYYSEDQIHLYDKVACVCAYIARASDEFHLERGDILEVVGIWDDGWATGIRLNERAEDYNREYKTQRDSNVSKRSRRDSLLLKGEPKAFPVTYSS